MNALWEEYIFRILHKHKPAETDVLFQNSDKFWENKCIRPDIDLVRNNEALAIDTKWKIIETNTPADNDLKQMFIYNLHWNAEKTLLVYPKTNQNNTKFGTFHFNNLGKNVNSDLLTSHTELQ